MPDLDALLQGHRDALTVRRVYGDPIERDGVTVVPAASVFGGTGGGGDREGNGGGGFGIRARPVGVYELRDGEVRWRPAVDVSRIMLGWQLVSALAVLGAWSVARRRAR
ncbi:MAG: sporulation protein [Thermoleophilia bacterium]|nr:sporulation protein [Thermoleophilia bacterium]